MDFIKCKRTAFQELCSPKKKMSIVSTFWTLASHNGHVSVIALKTFAWTGSCPLQEWALQGWHCLVSAMYFSWGFSSIPLQPFCRTRTVQESLQGELKVFQAVKHEEESVSCLWIREGGSKFWAWVSFSFLDIFQCGLQAADDGQMQFSEREEQLVWLLSLARGTHCYDLKLWGEVLHSPWLPSRFQEVPYARQTVWAIFSVS